MNEPSVSAQHVREALENLYANVELANTPLAQSGRFVDPAASILVRAQTLRNLLLDAIETLRPVRALQANHSLAGRSYEVLSLRYVSSLTVEEIGDRLAVGGRQVYRDLRRAEEEMTALLDSQKPPHHHGAQIGSAPPMSTTEFQAELETLTHRQDVVELGDLLDSAVRMVQPLADLKGVTLHCHPPRQPLPITATPSIAKEMLIQLLSALVQQGEPGQLLVIRAQDGGEYAEVHISGENHVGDEVDGAGFAWENPLLQNALLLAQLSEMTSVVRPADAHHRSVVIRYHALPVSFARQPILIVEDNPGVGELYQRYLQGSPWRAVLLANPEQTIAKAQELCPAVIILDVLMPETDGWSVLQTLRATPEVAAIPVIICSVINDPELAAALGAAGSLQKPLSRLELLDALQQVSRGQGLHLRT